MRRGFKALLAIERMALTAKCHVTGRRKRIHSISVHSPEPAVCFAFSSNLSKRGLTAAVVRPMRRRYPDDLSESVHGRAREAESPHLRWAGPSSRRSGPQRHGTDAPPPLAPTTSRPCSSRPPRTFDAVDGQVASGAANCSRITSCSSALVPAGPTSPLATWFRLPDGSWTKAPAERVLFLGRARRGKVRRVRKHPTSVERRLQPKRMRSHRAQRCRRLCSRYCTPVMRVLSTSEI
jgi:hypothetical protein